MKKFYVGDKFIHPDAQTDEQYIITEIDGSKFYLNHDTSDAWTLDDLIEYMFKTKPSHIYIASKHKDFYKTLMDITKGK